MPEIEGNTESKTIAKPSKQHHRQSSTGSKKHHKKNKKMEETASKDSEQESHREAGSAESKTAHVKHSEPNAKTTKRKKPKESFEKSRSERSQPVTKEHGSFEKSRSERGRPGTKRHASERSERHKHSESAPSSPPKQSKKLVTEPRSTSKRSSRQATEPPSPSKKPVGSSLLSRTEQPLSPKHDNGAAMHVEVHSTPLNDQQTRSRSLNSSANSSSSFRVNFDGSVTPTSSDGSGDQVDTAAMAATKNEMMEVGAVGHSDPAKLDKSLKKTQSENSMMKPEVAPEGNQRRCFKTKVGFLCFVFTVLVAVAAGIIVPLFLLDNDPEYNDAILRVSEYPKNQVISEVPVDLCNEWVPGEGKSELCPVQQTAVQGGDICNLLARAMLNSTAAAEIAIVNAGTCIGDIPAQGMRTADIINAIAKEQLYIVEMSGDDIEKLLEQAMEATFGVAGDSSAYPYAAGLRFGVDSNLEFGNRANQVEAIVGLIGAFRPISYRKFYSVVTTKELASGGLGYSQFGAIIDKWRRFLPYQTVDAFLSYAAGESTSWWVPNVAASSTQRFVSPDTEPKIAAVPTDICLGWTPDATSTSSLCSQGTAVVGGGSCNLVAWALLDQNWRADLAILNGGVCASELLSGDFTLSSATSLIPKNPDLVTAELSGTQIVAILEESIDAFVGATPGEAALNAYPFCSALRFDVNTMSSKGERLSSIEFFTASNRWMPFDRSNTYTVLTTSDLSKGNTPGYEIFGEVDSSTARNTRMGSVDTLLKFAADWEVLFEPPRDKHSTQAFT